MELLKRFIKNHCVGMLISLLLLLMALVMIGSSLGDSAIVDEVPHLVSGYSYLTTGDYRLNPEHPPLIKDLAGFSLLFIGPNFPYQFFYSHLNAQWQIGKQFLYKLGNNADLMLFLGRLPVIILSLILGYFVFRFARDLYGNRAGLFALFLYVFDANIIAHSRFVTTDLGIAAALFIHLYVLYKFLEEPTIKKLVLAGITLGIALITKFSAPLLLPIYFLLFLYLVFKQPITLASKNRLFKLLSSQNRRQRLESYTAVFLIIIFIGGAVTYLFYIPHIWRMSPSVQHAVVEEVLSSRPSMKILHRMIDIPILRPLSWYLLGFQMVSGHVLSGHTIFFRGRIGNGWWYYYPVAFLLKTAIPLMIFIGLALAFWKKSHSRFFIDYYLLVPVFLFFLMAMAGSLDLGIRHLLPIYPLLFVFVSKFINAVDFSHLRSAILGRNYRLAILPVAVALLLIWYAAGSLRIYPSYLAYFNELAGGPEGGVRYLTDSNSDWGQDLRRLASYVERNNISQIKINYFGGGDIHYYLGKKAVPWQGEKGKPSGWFAISASIYSLGTVRGEYKWLLDQKPVEKIGHSIFVYRF